MRILLLVVATLALAASAPAATGWSSCHLDHTLDVGGQAYVVYSEFGYYYFALWIYAETNGEPGLQRGGTSAFGDQDFLCDPHPYPDTLVF